MAVAGMHALTPSSFRAGPSASLGVGPDPLDPWERMWAPYDEATYAAVLAAVGPDDILLEIGAGDLRLARRLAIVSPPGSRLGTAGPGAGPGAGSVPTRT